ncbi:MAG: 16S rRNA (guanine(527)-N(7))-methyltransferase RsmG [Gammaproteobacteria bacterium]
MTNRELETTLQTGLHTLKLDVPAASQQALLAYIDLLVSWNKSFNLTAIRDPRDMVNQHLLDALVALPYIKRGPVLDVGSGAGLPGLPLAIVRPDLHFCLLDSNGKKVRFIKQVAITLQLTNVDVVQSRVETFQATEPFALIVSRAFASMEEFIRLTRHLLAPTGEWLTWKGELEAAELQGVTEFARVADVIDVELPGVTGKRQLVRLLVKPY